MTQLNIIPSPRKLIYSLAPVDEKYYFQDGSTFIRTQKSPCLGILTFSNGDCYKGQFKGSKREGQGLYRSKTNNFIVRGIFKNDYYTGEGSISEYITFDCLFGKSTSKKSSIAGTEIKGEGIKAGSTASNRRINITGAGQEEDQKTKNSTSLEIDPFKESDSECDSEEEDMDGEAQLNYGLRRYNTDSLLEILKCRRKSGPIVFSQESCKIEAPLLLKLESSMLTKRSRPFGEENTLVQSDTRTQIPKKKIIEGVKTRSMVTNHRTYYFGDKPYSNMKKTGRNFGRHKRTMEMGLKMLEFDK